MELPTYVGFLDRLATALANLVAKSRVWVCTYSGVLSEIAEGSARF